MELKNKEIKKLFDYVAPYFDLFSLPSAMTEFMACDEAIEGEIAAIKAELAKANLRKDIYHDGADHLRNIVIERGDELRKANNKISELEKELAESRNSNELLLRKENDRLRIIIDGLEKENANLRVTPPDVNVIESLEKENSELKTSNEHLNAKYKSHWKALSEARTEAALMKKENSYMRRINAHLSATCEARLKLLSEAREEVEQYKKSFMVDHEENNRLREVIDGRDNDIHDLEKKIQDLEEENASLTEDVDALVAENTDLQARLEECDISKREQASYKSLVEAIEFQGKRIEELEAEKARLKEAYDIHETTIKKLKENVDLSYGHEFEFGDEVFVPWSDGPYMYVKSGMMYNPRTERLVYVGKDQHLKWFGEKFSIV